MICILPVFLFQSDMKALRKRLATFVSQLDELVSYSNDVVKAEVIATIPICLYLFRIHMG